MKSFLEEYGFAILAAIVVILLIAMCTPVGNLIKQQILNMVDRFAGSADKKLGVIEAGEYQAILAGDKLSVFSPSTTDTFTAVLHWVEGGEKHYGDITDYKTNVFALSNKDGASPAAAATADPDDGSSYYVVVTNVGTGEEFISNSLIK